MKKIILGTLAVLAAGAIAYASYSCSTGCEKCPDKCQQSCAASCEMSK